MIFLVSFLVLFFTGCDNTSTNSDNSTLSNLEESSDWIQYYKKNDPCVAITGGTFIMGDTHQREEPSNENIPHEVTVSDFCIDSVEVTRIMYERVTGGTAEFQDCEENNCPIVNVLKNQSEGFCSLLGKRLPTEAEWEYAYRAGTTTLFFWGDDPFDDAIAEEYAYFEAMSYKMFEVAQKKPNPWGLYDMGGNAEEIVSDWYARDYYENSPSIDPAGPEETTPYIILRGGDFISGLEELQSATREYSSVEHKTSATGFRCAQ